MPEVLRYLRDMNISTVSLDVLYAGLEQGKIGDSVQVIVVRHSVRYGRERDLSWSLTMGSCIRWSLSNLRDFHAIHVGGIENAWDTKQRKIALTFMRHYCTVSTNEYENVHNESIGHRDWHDPAFLRTTQILPFTMMELLSV